jgi:uncharacterized membrane protein YccF (DUF307 family)
MSYEARLGNLLTLSIVGVPVRVACLHAAALPFFCFGMAA